MRKFWMLIALTAATVSTSFAQMTKPGQPAPAQNEQAACPPGWSAAPPTYNKALVGGPQPVTYTCTASITCSPGFNPATPSTLNPASHQISYVCEAPPKR